ncbi:2-hydroxychromene-2-carboxylate isomerase [Variovorax sp. PAMC 28711]|uniref:2-hydroxychromene-2-carboxylate isomerase n=1 Tax=Variovorax sp. PAMC 28711 TaxID=1795631 RepID=UPI00078D80B5|nr:2-hydroxychromene-2-carboxylate isomerase [Variovorax sp. PAMC 28711]AMM24482.1 2-hydroxychromene-2-carboxylate isomerase [Variovorax sp. PAMC 28711]
MSSTARTIDYYFAPQSPWTYLGHARFAAIARTAGAKVRVRPVDLGSVFPVSGGLPLGKRAPQRQAYRLVDLGRFSTHLSLPLNPKPKFFPVAGDDAAKLIIAVDLNDGVDAAMKLCGAIFTAVWSQERNIADPKVLDELIAECGLPGRRGDQSQSQAVQERYESYTQEAIATGIFGAPSYVLDGEIFWGQDRLEFVERALKTTPTNAGA